MLVDGVEDTEEMRNQFSVVESDNSVTTQFYRETIIPLYPPGRGRWGERALTLRLTGTQDQHYSNEHYYSNIISV